MTNKTWFKMSISVLMIAVLIMLTACGDTGNNASGKQKSLDFLWFSDGKEGEVIKEIIKEYEQSNTSVKINLIEVGFKDIQTKLKTMLSGGNPPALSRVTDTGSFANQAVDLTPYVGNAEQFEDQFIDSLKPYYVMDNKLVAAPMDVTANGLIYNKTLFDKAGVKVPTSPDEVWTWDEYIAALRQVMDKGGARYGMVWDVTPHRWSTLLYQNGGSILTEDGSAAAINSEAGIRSMEMFKQLHQEGIMPESVWLGGENPNNLFRSGTVAAHWAGNWMISNYKDITDFEWGVTYMPKGTQRSSVPGGKFLMAFKGSGQEQEAAKFIEYLTSKEVNSKYNQESLFMSPRKDSATLNYEFGKEMFEIFSDELKNSSPLAANDWSRQTLISKISTDLKNNIMDVLSDKATPQQALDTMAKKINEAIASQ
ncbi:ABC transporter substrate-binding protein [Paenibacillus silvae]|uniref:ABC transporter substrate-binding protein n=1 Tax=Paenibacillus silvae TaxID=1325358 RepID=UPI0011A8DA14|nr:MULTISPECIES: sugar ABC transporter substrate-binding protein [Paenibacillus]MCK6073865.1 sugar ABC transporter substrate-binding protein [Paenibacillus silvae]MCK6148659.1 sugar ABC transporter substrate-binding protein [Paenibacillus silvae]MCK6266959.1 sugar ABC transporter substrate-binding protein [Paenibacillus silvae]